MTTLSSPPLAPLLERLFAEAEAPATPQSRAAVAAPASSATGDTPEYLEFYARAKDLYLAVSRDSARLLYMLARATGARTIVEFGMSFGISTLHLAAALRDNGGGRLITSEFEPGKVGRARETFAEAGLADLIEIREGDALRTLAGDLPESIDLVLLDGAKSLYAPVLDLLEPALRPGALVLADNVDMAPDFLQRVRAGDGGYESVAFADDVELSMRVG